MRRQSRANVPNIPGEVIDRPNPRALPSHIPDSVLNLAVKLEEIALSDADLQALEEASIILLSSSVGTRT
jgi:hypothetical protein